MTAEVMLRASLPAEPTRALPRAAGAEREPGAAPPAAAPATPNPRLRLDGSLGMVVIEFRDSAGEVRQTIPSPREMDAYRAVAVANTPVPAGISPPQGATMAGTAAAPAQPGTGAAAERAEPAV